MSQLVRATSPIDPDEDSGPEELVLREMNAPAIQQPQPAPTAKVMPTSSNGDENASEHHQEPDPEPEETIEMHWQQLQTRKDQAAEIFAELDQNCTKWIEQLDKAISYEIQQNELQNEVLVY